MLLDVALPVDEVEVLLLVDEELASLEVDVGLTRRSLRLSLLNSLLYWM